MMELFNYCLVVGQTDVGRKRSANEDSMGNAVTINGLVSIVCDGMGGTCRWCDRFENSR